MAGIFSRFIFNNAIFNTGAVTPPVTDTHDGGVKPSDYRRYRRKIEKMIKASEKYNREKYINEAVAVAEIVEELPIEAPVIQEIAQAIKDEISLDQIDFTLLQAELIRVIRYLDTVIVAKLAEIKAQREMEDEIALLMLI